ncbi:MAG: SusC/RagA family TonB-linked outer membrane protein [Bacteroidales bacterium]
MRKFLLLLGVCILLVSSIYAQKTITGKVIDGEGLGVTGASVIQKGTNKGAITDIDGNYSINVPENAVLQFTFMGMTTVEEVPGSRSVVNVTLKNDALNIDEVVVTAMGLKREEKALGYAFTKVDGEELAQANSVNPISSLQGQSAGVQIDQIGSSVVSSPRISIRGNSTLGGNNQPLIVVDGVIVDGGTDNGQTDWGNGFKTINSMDIESMNVLRGAAATALYGSQALNGVLLISTKSGAKGRKGLNISVSSNSSIGILKAPFEMQNEYGAGVYAGANSTLSNPYYTTQEYRKNSDGKNIIAPTTLNWGPRMDGRSVIDYVGDEVAYSAFPDNWKSLYDQSYTTTNSVALSKNSEDLVMRFAYTNQYSKGYYARNSFNKNTLNLNVSYKFNKYIAANINAAYMHSKHENPTYQHGDGTYAASRLLGWYGLTRSYDVEKYANPKYYLSSVNNEWPQPPTDPSDPGYGIPRISQLYYYFHWKDQWENEDNLRASATIDITPIDWIGLSIGARTNLSYIYREVHQWYDYGDGSTRLMKNYNQNNFVDYFAKLNVNQKFLNDDLDLNVILQAESQEWFNNAVDGFATKHTVPGYWFWGNFPNGTNKRVSGDYSNTRMLNSLSGIVDLAYKNQLFLSVTARNDWSSTLVYSNGHGNPSFFYPSVSLSWIANETFNLPDMFNFLKVRASYGEVGGSPDAYVINQGYKTAQHEFMDNSYLQFDSNTLPNLNLKPYRSREFEVGFNTSMFDNRLGVDLAVYKRNTFNQIINLPVSGTSGVSSMQINAGDIQDIGLEITLNGTPVKVGDFAWDVSANYYTHRNTIKSLYGDIKRSDLSKGRNIYTGANAYAYVGGDYGVIVATTVPRTYINPDNPNDPNNGKYIATWDQDNGTVGYTNSGIQFKAGDITPDFIGGLTNTFSWKNLSLNCQLYFKIGGDVALSTYGTGMLYAGTGVSSLAYRDAEHGGIKFTTPAGIQGNGTFEDGYVPANVIFDKGHFAYDNNVGGMDYADAIEKGLVYPSHISSYYMWNHAGGSYAGADIFENSYITLKNVAISYTLPNSFASKLRLQKATVSLYGRDLAVLYNTLPDKANPQFMYSSNSGAFTDGEGIGPWVSTLGLSLNVEF